MRPELPILIKARALIADPAKWGKGPRSDGYERGLCTYCAAEAIDAVDSDLDQRHASYRAIQSAASVNSLVYWNDAPERTHADILAAFDKAIEDAS